MCTCQSLIVFYGDQRWSGLHTIARARFARALRTPRLLRPEVAMSAQRTQRKTRDLIANLVKTLNQVYG